jgi:hypothetical protein
VFLLVRLDEHLEHNQFLHSSKVLWIIALFRHYGVRPDRTVASTAEPSSAQSFTASSPFVE